MAKVQREASLEKETIGEKAGEATRSRKRGEEEGVLH
jgi:hypothetical protein